MSFTSKDRRRPGYISAFIDGRSAPVWSGFKLSRIQGSKPEAIESASSAEPPSEAPLSQPSRVYRYEIVVWSTERCCESER